MKKEQVVGTTIVRITCSVQILVKYLSSFETKYSKYYLFSDIFLTMDKAFIFAIKNRHLSI